MGSQRFCLRWNNHQSNLLSVFDQLLHEEAFVDVTLAVEGQYLKAHKMVLSACSPYFQTLFVGHPDKHPIVILKDVPYSDMRSLLDFMYRGEVSVDQDRLTAFLKVAESLKIKGLTEVNEERCDLPSIANSLLGGGGSSGGGTGTGGSNGGVSQATGNQPSSLTPGPPQPPVSNQSTPPAVNNQSQPVSQASQALHPTPPPPSLHRIHPLNPKRASYSSLIPKRKRGRPRKLSSSGPSPNSSSSQSLDLQHSEIKHNNVEHNHVSDGYPVKVKEEDVPNCVPADNPKDDKVLNDCEMSNQADSDPAGSSPLNGPANDGSSVKSEPTPSTSAQDGGQEFANTTSTDRDCFMSSRLILPPVTVTICEDVSLTPAACPFLPEQAECLSPLMDSEDVVITPILEEIPVSPIEDALITPGIHFLSGGRSIGGDDSGQGIGNSDDEDSSYRRDLLEYFMNSDGSVVCKWCGELLPSRTHWYRHKYRFHSATPPAPIAPLYKCLKCNIYFKSRKGYLGHVNSRHPDNKSSVIVSNTQSSGAPTPVDDSVKMVKRGRRASDELLHKSPEEYEKQREKEEKLVAEIINRVKKECEAQGSTITRKGYSRRSTVMNS